MLPDGSVDDAVTDARLQKVDLGGGVSNYIYIHIISPYGSMLQSANACLVAWLLGEVPKATEVRWRCAFRGC